MSYIQDESAYNAAIAARIKANSRKTNANWINTDDNRAVVDFLEKNTRNEFYKKMLQHFEDYYKLSPGQVAAIRKGMDKRTAQIAERAANSTSAHVGNIGERCNFALTIEKIVTFKTHFSYYGEDCYIYICSDESGNKVVYKGSKEFFSTRTEQQERTNTEYVANPNFDENNNCGATSRYMPVETKKIVDITFEDAAIEGDKLTGKATIKAHDLRDGIKQTVISRPKFEVKK